MHYLEFALSVEANANEYGLGVVFLFLFAVHLYDIQTSSSDRPRSIDTDR